jgi:hypothetical protein
MNSRLNVESSARTFSTRMTQPLSVSPQRCPDQALAIQRPDELQGQDHRATEALWTSSLVHNLRIRLEPMERSSSFSRGAASLQESI